MLRRHITPSLIISLLALFIATSGASYAALKIPKDSVGTKQLKTSAVTSKKVKDGSLKAKDFASGQLPAGAVGPTGPAGPPGARGSDALTPTYRAEQLGLTPMTGALQSVVSLSLPAGDYVLMSRVNIFMGAGGPGSVLCSIENDAAQAITVPTGGAIAVAQTATISLPATGTAELMCLESGPGAPNATQASITAVKVSSITGP